jgi:hypothetical protein
MAEQDRLQFGRRDLESLVLDEFLEPVDHVQVAIGVDVAEVTGAQPAVGIDHRGRGLRVVEVALHHLRPAHPDLALFADPGVRPADRVDDPRLRVRHRDADRFRPEPARRRDVRGRR